MSLGKLPEDRFEKMIYRCQKNSPKSNWFNEMRTVFSQIGFTGDFEYWNGTYISQEKNRFLDILHSHFRQELETWVANSSFSFLSQNRTNLHKPAHFLNTANFWDRRTIARLFLKGYKFESVTGAWHNLDKRERFCQFCINQLSKVAIGDEYHYLVVCPRFQISRNKIGFSASEIIQRMCNNLKDSTTTASHYHTLAKFIRVSFDHLRDPFTTRT